VKCLFYNGVRLQPGSRALELWVAGEREALAKHMKELDQKEAQMQGTPAQVAERISYWRQTVGLDMPS
jgi:NADPH-dependent ferric siderophore reductase